MSTRPKGPAETALSETASQLLHQIGGRAAHAGHVLLDGPEIAFALFAEGAGGLEPIDADMHLFKLTPVARERLAM